MTIRQENQIDHIAMEARYASSVLDVRSLRDGETDRILEEAEIRFELSVKRT